MMLTTEQIEKLRAEIEHELERHDNMVDVGIRSGFAPAIERLRNLLPALDAAEILAELREMTLWDLVPPEGGAFDMNEVLSDVIVEAERRVEARHSGA